MQAMKIIAKNFNVSDFSDLGLYALLNEGTEDRYLDVDKTTAECGLKGEVSL